MSVICPACAKGIPSDDVNVKEGVAFCRACGRLSRLAEIAAQEDLPPTTQVLSETPPAGCRFEDDGVTLRIRASARSAGTAIGALFFAGFWNSIVSVFVILTATSLWINLVGPLPSWFPTPFSGNSGSSNGPMPLGVALFMVLFLTPFIAVGLMMTGVALVSMFGHVTVMVRGSEGTVLTGVGPIGWRRRFDAVAVTSVRVVETKGKDSSGKNIEIEAGKKIKFGSLLTDRRRAWMGGMLRAVLLPDPASRGRTLSRGQVPRSAGPPLPEVSS